MKKVIKTEETYVDVILADIPNKRIYVTQETMKRSILCISTVEMIKEYKDRNFDIKNYTQRVFSMFGGKKTRVKLQFVNSLLDTVIDRFGTKEPFYSKADDKHFIVNCEVEISPQFFSWLCGFDTRVVILEPEAVKEQYQAHLKRIIKKYSKT